MYGQRAKELLLELRRTDELPPYNDEGVRQVQLETEDLRKEVIQTVRENPGGIEDTGVKAGLVVHTESIQRNKRCLLSYHMTRCDRIEQLRWQYGSVLPEFIRTRLSADEADYLKSYSSLLTRYMSAIDCDLTAVSGGVEFPELHDCKWLDYEGTMPPKFTQVLVRALRDVGSVLTSRGPIELRKDQSLKMLVSDAEPLIRVGWLEQMPEE